MTFASPLGLIGFVVVPVVLVGYVRVHRRRPLRAAALAAQGLVATAAHERRFRRHLPFALFTVALCLLVVAFARPMATIKTLQRQATVIVALDVSNSMAAKDVKPSRIQAAKAAADTFIRQQAPGVRIGVVAFGPSALIVQRPTLVHAAALQAVTNLTLGGGTSIATGILTSLDAIAGKTLRVNAAALANDNSGEVNIGYYGGTTIVLFSDGENTANSNPVTVARLASVAGVRIQTIGVGTVAGTTINIDGFTIATALDPQTLKSVAMVTNGTYHQVDDTSGLRALAKAINLHFVFVSSQTDISALFAAAGALVLVLAAVLSMIWFGRIVV